MSLVQSATGTEADPSVVAYATPVTVGNRLVIITGHRQSLAGPPSISPGTWTQREIEVALVGDSSWRRGIAVCEMVVPAGWSSGDTFSIDWGVGVVGSIAMEFTEGADWVFDEKASASSGTATTSSQTTGTTPAADAGDVLAVTGIVSRGSTDVTWSVVSAVAEVDYTSGGGAANRLTLAAGALSAAGQSAQTWESTATLATARAVSALIAVWTKPAGGGTTPVGKDLGLVWDTRAVVGDPVQAIWDTRQVVGDPLDTQWSVRALAGDPLQAVWDTRATVGDDLDLSWDVAGALTPVGRDLDAVWDTRALAGDTVDVQWDTRILAAKNVQSVWDVRTTVADPLEVLWNVDSALTVVGDDLALSWDVNALAAVGRDLGTVWDVRTTVGDTLENRWDTRALVGDTLAVEWSVKALASDTAQLVWNVESDAALRDIHALADIAPATWAAATLHKSTAATVDPTRWDAT